MHAFCIIGGNESSRMAWISGQWKKLGTSEFDRILLSSEEPSLGIEAVRDFQTRLYLKPLNSPCIVGIIYQAQRLTKDAQNALLKTLEEPPPHVTIFLETDSDALLLPTIRSRCQTVVLPSENQYTEHDMKSCLDTLSQLIGMQEGKKLQWIDMHIKTKEEAMHWTNLALHSLHSLFISQYPENQANIPYQTAITFLRSLLAARERLQANVNPKLVIDCLFLS